MTGSEQVLYSALYAYFYNNLSADMDIESAFKIFERFKAVKDLAVKDALKELAQ